MGVGRGRVDSHVLRPVHLRRTDTIIILRAQNIIMTLLINIIIISTIHVPLALTEHAGADLNGGGVGGICFFFVFFNQI